MTPLVASTLVLVALGSPVDQLGFGSRSAALVGATVARPEGGGIAMVNPALAASAPDVEGVLGYSVTSLQMRLNGERHELDDARAVHFALIMPLGLGDYGRLGASFAFSVPDERLLRPEVLALDRPRFLMFENRLQRVAIDAALAYALAFGDFEFGVAGGATVLGGASGQGVSFHLVEKGSYSSADASVSARLPLVTSPLGGAFFRWRDWHLGLYVRGPIAFDVTVGTGAAIELAGLRGDVYTAVAAQDFYTPAKIAAGLAWTGESVAVHFALETYLWSGYDDTVATMTDVAFEGLGIDIPASSAIFADRMRDVVSPRLGVEWRLPDLAHRLSVVLRGGALFEPTPVVESALRLDSDKVGGALGIGITTVGPLWAFPRPLSLDAHLLVVGLVPRTFSSSGPSSPWPDLTVGGVMVSGGATLTARF